MASNFPSSLDSFTNPSSSDAMDSVSVPHATQHSDLNDAVEALQAKVGADSSAVTSSHDYKIADHASRLTTLEGAPAAGLTLIKKVTFSAVTSFSEDNVFTSDYDNYLILISGVSSSASDTQLRLRVGGVDASGSNYLYQGLNVTGATVGGFNGTTTQFTLGSDGTTRFDHRAEIFGPAIADNTGWLSFGHRDNARISFRGSYHNLSTAYDGFTVLDNLGNITGTLWLYGYDKD